MAVVQTLIGNVKGPAGATGATGAQGPQGDAATIAVGSVTSAAYGTPASVTNSGTSGAAVFDFVIPQGKPGEKTTKMGELVLDTITTSTDEFPSPAVDDTGAIAFGKIRKFFADTLSALASKIDTSKIANNLTTTDTSYVLSAAQGKALNDSLENYDIQTISSQYFSTIKLIKNCHTVTLLLLTVATSTALDTSSDYVDYFTIPAGFRPNDTLYWRFYSVYSSTRSLFTIRINSNGVVSLLNHDGVQHPGMAQTFTFVQRY